MNNEAGSGDVFHLERFVAAQDPVFSNVCAELANGEKLSHWMWFIFPQIQGLGSSATAQRFAISGMAEARAYLRHPILGPRLAECTGLVNGVTGRSASEIFGYPDDLKFHSSITLFASAATGGAEQIFVDALARYFGGKTDRATLDRLK